MDPTLQAIAARSAQIMDVLDRCNATSEEWHIVVAQMSPEIIGIDRLADLPVLTDDDSCQLVWPNEETV